MSIDRGNPRNNEKLSLQLDKLFDILRCQCPIKLCTEIGCSLNCKQEAHITCTCKREEKVPVLELRFIRSQRDKEGSNSSHIIGGKDESESKRQEKAIKNKEKKLKKAEMKALKDEAKAKARDEEENEVQDFLSHDDFDEGCDDDDVNQNTVPLQKNPVAGQKKNTE